jgi:hypothetical protein
MSIGCVKIDETIRYDGELVREWARDRTERIERRTLERKQRNQQEFDVRKSYFFRFHSVLGEAAVAINTGYPLPRYYEPRKEPDIGPWHVRTTKAPGGHLWAYGNEVGYPDQKCGRFSKAPFVLVISDDPHMRIMGWLRGEKIREYGDWHGYRGPGSECWWASQVFLRDWEPWKIVGGSKLHLTFAKK